MFRTARGPGLKKKPSTRTASDWLKLLVAEDICPEGAARQRQEGGDPGCRTGALLKKRTGSCICPSGLILGGRTTAAATMLVDSSAPAERKAAGLTREFWSLLEALQKGAIGHSPTTSTCSRSTLDQAMEQILDKFDIAFASIFMGIEALVRAGMAAQIPEEWLRAGASPPGHRNSGRLEKLAGDKLMEIQSALQRTEGRHAGGNKWIGTGGTPPFGNGGYAPGRHPRRRKVGQSNRSTVKVWENASSATSTTPGTWATNIKVALRRLRRFAREGAADELDPLGTIAGTAKNAGWLDLHLRPEPQRGQGAAFSRCRRF